jgi:hypothetical protein
VSSKVLGGLIRSLLQMLPWPYAHQVPDVPSRLMDKEKNPPKNGEPTIEWIYPLVNIQKTMENHHV